MELSYKANAGSWRWWSHRVVQLNSAPDGNAAIQLARVICFQFNIEKTEREVSKFIRERVQKELGAL